MLEHEWHELEQLCNRISTLRDREAHAERSKNIGLLAGLQQDIGEASRQRTAGAAYPRGWVQSARRHRILSKSCQVPRLGMLESNLIWYCCG